MLADTVGEAVRGMATTASPNDLGGEQVSVNTLLVLADNIVGQFLKNGDVAMCLNSQTFPVPGHFQPCAPGRH